jgi:hypothetical protein
VADSTSWSRSLGAQGDPRVRVYERHFGSVIYMSVWLPGEGERRTSLGHRDKQRAVSEAREVLRLRTADDAVAESPPPLTLGTLFGRYVVDARHHPDGSLKTEAYLRHVAKTGEHLAKYFGMAFPVEDLTPDRIREYARLRREGVIGGRAVRTSTIHRDLGMLKAALNWATTVYDGHRALLARNPRSSEIPSREGPEAPRA